MVPAITVAFGRNPGPIPSLDWACLVHYIACMSLGCHYMYRPKIKNSTIQPARIRWIQPRHEACLMIRRHVLRTDWDSAQSGFYESDESDESDEPILAFGEWQ